jgi:3-phosphoshikimate 1-carboxyvinyltransferase
MALPDLLPIQPFTRPVCGSVVLPGSKSITNRALLLAALCDGPVTLTGALFSEDTELMAEALRQLGFVVKEDAEKKTIYVEGRGGKIPVEQATLHVGLAGTAARFLTALCAAAPSGVFKIDGVPQMRKRPMKGLIDTLRTLGAEILCLGYEGFFPIEIHARGLRGGESEIDASESSQLLSALLMVAPLAGINEKPRKAPTVRLRGETVSRPFIDMTLRMMQHFGQTTSSADGSAYAISINTYRCPNQHYDIEGDATAASYFAALPIVVGGSVTVEGLYARNDALQGDIQFLRELANENLITLADHTVSVGHPRAGLNIDFNNFSDTFLTLAAVAPLFDGNTTITGIAHTRKQETDRVAGMANELRKLCPYIREEHDSLSIGANIDRLRNVAQKGPIEIETYGDHRFAMSFAILGCHDLLGNGQPWLTIKNPACCAKTFPNFFDVLNELRTNSHLSS